MTYYSQLKVYDIYIDDIPSDIVLDAPLSDSYSTALTGQELKKQSGTPVYTNFKNVPCAYFDGKTALRLPNTNLPVEDKDRTVNFWAYMYPYPTTQWRMAMFWGYGSSQNGNALFIQNQRFGLDTNNYSVYISTQKCLNYQWHMYTVVYKYPIAYLYLDGVFLYKTQFTSFNTSNADYAWIGRAYDTGGWSGKWTQGYLADVRIYSRGLNKFQIRQLYKRLNPQKDPSVADSFGLVFHAPLQQQAQTAATGQPLTYSTTVTYEEKDGYTGCNLNDGYITCLKLQQFPQRAQERTVSVKIYLNQIRRDCSWLSYGKNQRNQRYAVGVDNSTGYVASWANSNTVVYKAGPLIETGKWYTVTITYKDGVQTYFLDGYQITRYQHSDINTYLYQLCLGKQAVNHGGTSFTNGYMRDVRIYNKELNQLQVYNIHKDRQLDAEDDRPQYTPDLTNGLVVHVPLQTDISTTTGQTLTQDGTVTFGQDTRKYAQFKDRDNCIYLANINSFYKNCAVSIAYWFKYVQGQALVTLSGSNYSILGGNQIWAIGQDKKCIVQTGNATPGTKGQCVIQGEYSKDWHHLYGQYNLQQGIFRVIIDGDTTNVKTSDLRYYDFNYGLVFCIGSLYRARWSVYGHARYSDVRLYNRNLTDAQIKLLAGK